MTPTPARDRRRNAQLDRDPTRSTMLRKEYATAHSRRWRWLKGAIRDGVQAHDALGIGQDPPPRPVVLQEDPDVQETLRRLREQIRDAQVDGDHDRVRELAREFIGTDGRFNFPSDASRMQAFSSWLEEAEQGGIIEVTRGADGTPLERGGWQETYVNRSYRKGIRQADQRLAQEGVDVPDDPNLGRIVQVPIHRRKLELLFTRNFTELEGITEASAQQMRRELAEGLAQGENPRKVATRLNDRVDNVGVHRSRLLARTEIIRAHAESTLTRYEQFGIEGVAGKAELATAGDSRVCAICAGLEGQVFSVEEARGVIPLHPQCRCTWIPVVDTERLNARENRDGARTFLRRLEKARQELWPTWSRPPQIGKAA